MDNAGNTINTPTNYRMILAKAVNLTGTTTIAGATTLQVQGGTLGTLNGGANSVFEIGSAAGGSLTIVGTASVATINVDSGSSLNAGNVVGTINNHGSLGTLTPESTLHITGALNQPQQATVAQEGLLSVRTNGTAADLFTPTTANLFGTVKVSGVGSNTYNIVMTSAPGGLTTGTLNSHTADGLFAPGSLLFSSTLSEVNNQVLQLTTVQSDVTPFAQTPNERARGRRH